MGQHFVFENINVYINECYMFIFLIIMIYEECMHIIFVCMYTGKKNFTKNLHIHWMLSSIGD